MVKTCISLLILFLNVVSYAQSPTNIDMLQGYWVQNSEENNISFHKYYEGQYLYEITDWENRVSVSKYFIAFLDNTGNDSISLLDLGVDGDLYAFFDILDVENGSYVSVGSSIYSFDLAENYFNFYANSPVSHLKIASLPSKIYRIFLKRKEALDKEVIFDFVPDYLKEGFNALPTQIEAVNERVYFHILPEASTKRNAFIVSGDRAKVLYQKPNWYYIVYYGASKNSVGWVKKADVIVLD